MAFTSTVHPVRPLFLLDGTCVSAFIFPCSSAPRGLGLLPLFEPVFHLVLLREFLLKYLSLWRKKKGINEAEADLLPLVTQRLVSSDEPWDVGADGVIINQKQRSLLWCLYFLCRL